MRNNGFHFVTLQLQILIRTDVAREEATSQIQLNTTNVVGVQKTYLLVQFFHSHHQMQRALH